MPSKWGAWIEDRFGLEEIYRSFLHRRVPKTAWYHGDGATLLLLLMVLIATGMFMTPTYSPDPDTAYQSVNRITQEQLLGWFVRSLHYWSAGLMMVMLVFHLLRQILLAGYKSPREGTWLLGVVMFFLIILMAFTGYLLRWDERALHALRASLHMFWNVPIIGERLVVFIQGGYELGAQTLTRIYAVHVVFVPMLLIAFASYHLYLVIVRGVTSPAERQQPIESAQQQKELYHRIEQDESRSETFHPYTTAKSGAMAIVVFMLAVVLAIVAGPAPLQPEANLVERAFPAEEWYFYWYSALIALLPPWLAPSFVVLFPLVVFVVLVLLPFVDRSPHRGFTKRPIAIGVVVLTVVALLYLSDLRRRSPWTAWPREAPPAVPTGVTLTPAAERGRLLFAVHGCNTCHAVAGDGAQVGPDLSQIAEPYSYDELRAWVLNPPAEVPMPSYEDRISEEDLDAIVNYVLVAQTFPIEVREAEDE
ncbi:MAG: cytochrome b N-terminal domain-containing protein [Phycisphaeraceae bacterium]